MQNNMAIEFFHNSKILHFLGVKSEIYHCVTNIRQKDSFSRLNTTIKLGLVNSVRYYVWDAFFNLLLSVLKYFEQFLDSFKI